MEFWDLFWPFFASMMAVTAFFEGFHFFIGYWLNWRARKRQEEAREKMIASGMDPHMVAQMQQMVAQGGPQMLFDMPGMEEGMTTASGEATYDGGQYL